MSMGTKLLRHKGKCSLCHKAIAKGTPVLFFDAPVREVHHCPSCAMKFLHDQQMNILVMLERKFHTDRLQKTLEWPEDSS